MARSTSSYGKAKAPLHTVRLAPYGLCPTHRTALLENGTECWDCGPGVIPGGSFALRQEVAPPAPRPVVAASSERMATAKQMDLLKTLFAERKASEAATVIRTALLAEYKAGRLTAKLASTSIDALFQIAKDAAAPAAPTTPQADVADGYYAITSSGDNDLAFYRVTSSDKWGKSVQLIVGGHADRFVARKAVAGILDRIAADADAGPRYGREIGQCCACNRTLTDETSRQLGIGPTCRAGGRD